MRNNRAKVEICREIIARGLKVKWQTPNGIRASVTDHEKVTVAFRARIGN